MTPEGRSNRNDWFLAVLLAAVGSLSTIAWNGHERRIASLEERGSAPMRIEVSRLSTRAEEIQREIEALQLRMDQLQAEWRYYRQGYEPNAQTPSRPRFPRN